MSEKVKIGVRVDKQKWQQFRNYVQERHGRTRGVLGSELESAMQQRMSGEYPNDQLSRIENDVATLKAIVAEVEADGGESVAMLSEQDSTHTHRNGTSKEPSENVAYSSKDGSDTPGTKAESSGGESGDSVTKGKPHPKSTRGEKVEWLANQFELGDDAQLHRRVVKKKIEDAYSFKGDTVDELAELVIDELDLFEHPNVDGGLVTEERYDIIIEEMREEAGDLMGV